MKFQQCLYWLCGSWLAASTITPAGADKLFAVKGDLAVWGYQTPGQGLDQLPDFPSSVVALACGANHCLALRADGTVVAWGTNDFGQCNVPGTARHVVAIAAGGDQSMALQADGTVIRWGYNGYNLQPMPGDITDIIAIAAGYSHCLALRSTGTVAAWGGRTHGGGSYPPIEVPDGLNGVSTIAAGNNVSLALRAHPVTLQPGRLVDWGYYPFTHGIRGALYPDDGTAISAGNNLTAVLRSDGTVVVGGGDDAYEDGRTDARLAGVKAISVLSSFPPGLLALKHDSTLVWWGDEGPYPELWSFSPGVAQVNALANLDVGLISCGGVHCLALRQPPLPSVVRGAVNEPFSLAYPVRLAVPRFTAAGLPPGLRLHASTGVLSGTPLTGGSWQAVILTENRTQTIETNLTITIESAAYAAWRKAYWAAASDQTAYHADPDGDGRQNGVEYALGSAPDVPDPSPIQTVIRDADGRITLTIDVPAGRAGLVLWSAEFSSVLPITAPAEATAEAAVDPDAAIPSGMIRYRFTDPRLSHPKPARFARLKVTLP